MDSTANRRLRWFQFRLRTVLILTAVVAAGLTAWRLFDSWPEVDEKVRAVLRADEPSRRSSAYRELFKTAGAEGLAYLKRHADDSIAIQAAWEEVELTVPLKPTQRVTPDRKALQAFLNFLEKRARVQAPKWWAEGLLNAQAHKRYNVYPRLSTVSEEQYAGQKREGQKVVVQVGDDCLVIPEGTLDFGRGPVALFMPTRCYVAVHDDWGGPFTLTAIERESTKVLWKTSVWGYDWDDGIRMGWNFMYVELTERDNRVFVFGVGGGGFHVEAFRSDNGENLFRASNAY